MLRFRVQYLVYPLTLFVAGRVAAAADFQRDVQPILEQRCVECHGAKKQKSGIRFDRKSSVFGAGDSGSPAVVPGNSAGSLLFQRITTSNDDEIMPPKGEKLTPAQVALLKAWIDEGADWPQQLAGEEKKHWAYEKPARPAVPKIQNPKSKVQNPIDSFVMARLEKEGLDLSPMADRTTLIRRVSLDLIGLPPTGAEVEAFLKDRAANAYEKVVDRLLASPHYGERWARPWLDSARYADTQGFEKDNRRSMWPYRDWVIRALNADMPFDRFTVEQLAGDMLPGATEEQKIATGFHRNTMTNTEGGTDDEEFRYEAVIDRVNTTWAVWMGSTFNCAQCHNHKYDPFTTQEYYRFMAFLNNTADADKDDERPTMKVFRPGEEGYLAAARARLNRAEKVFNGAAAQPEIAKAQRVWEQKTIAALTNWQVLDPGEFVSAGGATLTRTASQSIAASGKNPSNDTYVVTAPLTAGRITGVRLEVLENGPDKTLGRHSNGGFVLRAFELAVRSNDVIRPVKLKSVTADFSQKEFDVANVLSGKGDGWAIATSDLKNRVRRSAYFTLVERLELNEATTLVAILKHSEKHPGANIERFRLYTTESEQVGPPASLPDDVRSILLAAPEKRDDKQRAKLKEHFHGIAPELKDFREWVAATKNAERNVYDAIPSTAVMEELEKPRESYRHVRGAYLVKGERVSPGTPATMHAFPTNQPLDRLGAARWIVDTNNPLTARVMVNRFWDELFGRGIVETVEEFGTQGEPPSHPELLDWLACEFMQPTWRQDDAAAGHRPWGMKGILKTIVMSATYRQASRTTPELLARDPMNRLLARGPRVRLHAETVRDQALAVSGLLSPKIGGPSVMPPQPDGLWMVVYSGDKWETSKGEDKYRRGLYTFWRRSMPHPMMVSFDAPSREFCVLKRNRSNTPLQALNTLNDPAFVECAQALARKIAARPESGIRERVEFAFRTCLARAPGSAETDRLVKLYEQQLENYRRDAAAAERMATSQLGKPDGKCDLAELAAWTVVANVLLNLDETITKG